MVHENHEIKETPQVPDFYQKHGPTFPDLNPLDHIRGIDPFVLRDFSAR